MLVNLKLKGAFAVKSWLGTICYCLSDFMHIYIEVNF